jgi:hypothetical protein
MAHLAHQPGLDDHPQVHHEESDVNIRGIFGFGAGLVVVAAIIHVAIWLLFMYFTNREAVSTPRQYPLASQQSQLPPEPRLQVTPREDLQTLRAAEERVLRGYGWVDRNEGVVHIPIDVAMKQVVEHGLPSRPEARETR